MPIIYMYEHVSHPPALRGQLAELGHRPPAEVALLPVDDHVEGVADSGRRTAQRALPEHGFPTSLARQHTQL